MSQGRRRPLTKPHTPRRIPHNQALQTLSPRLTSRSAKDREDGRKSPKIRGIGGGAFAPVRGCSGSGGPQKDCRGSLNGPQKDRSGCRATGRGTRCGASRRHGPGSDEGRCSGAGSLLGFVRSGCRVRWSAAWRRPEASATSKDTRVRDLVLTVHRLFDLQLGKRRAAVRRRGLPALSARAVEAAGSGGARPGGSSSTRQALRRPRPVISAVYELRTHDHSPVTAARFQTLPRRNCATHCT